MADIDTLSSLPELDEMLESLLLIEEGEHEFGEDEEDVEETRHLFFPATLHGAYFDHASVGPLPRPVSRTLHEYVDDVSSFGSVNRERWLAYCDGARRRLANLINVPFGHIALTGNTGDALGIVADGLPWQAGDSIVTAEGEFPANVYPWLNLQEQGVQVRIVPMRDNRITVEDVIANIDASTRLVSLSLVEFCTGFRTDIKTIAAYCHERGIICGIDAIQALGALAVDVQQLKVDFVAGGGYKWLLAPQKTGFLYLSNDLITRLKVKRRGWYNVENPFDFFAYDQPLKKDATRFESSGPNTLPIVGLDAALGIFEAIDGGMEAIEARVLGLTNYLLSGLDQLGYPVASPRGKGERSGIVCFSPHPEQPALNVEQISWLLRDREIYTTPRGNWVRVSPHFYNTPQEIDKLLNVLEDLKRPLVQEQPKKK